MLTDRLHVAVLCSKRAPGLDALLRHPARGIVFEIDCLVTSELLFPEVGVPVVTHPIRTFYAAASAPLRNMSVRRDYDAATTRLLKRIGIDAVVMLGYLYVATDTLLSPFRDRIFNLHDSDLPKYPGLHATRDAILAGERETRSVVHVVTEELDRGPVIARSEAFPVAQFARDAALACEYDIVRAYAYAHREWMMRRAWADLAVAALERVEVFA